MADLAEAISIEDAVKGFTQGTPEEERPEEQAQEDLEADEDSSELEADAEDSEIESEEDEASEPTEEHQDSDEEDEEPTFTVWTGSEEVEVDLEELKNGYMLKADHTRKTQELAEVRKNLGAQAERAQARLNQLDQELESIDTMLLGTPPVMPNIDLMSTDPKAYELGKRQVEEWQATKANLAKWREQLSEERTKTAEDEYKKVVVKEAKAFESAFEVHEQAAFSAKLSEVRKYLGEGFSAPGGQKLRYEQGELVNILDHRAYVIADKARKYDELMAGAKPKAKIKARKAKVKMAPSQGRKPKAKRASDAQSRFNAVTSNPQSTVMQQINAGAAAFAESQSRK